MAMEDDDDDEHHTIYHVTPTMETPTMVTYLTPGRIRTPTEHDHALGCLRFKHAPSDVPLPQGADDLMLGSLLIQCGV